jgi:glycerate 2-kinase
MSVAPRRLLLDLFNAGLAAVDGRVVVARTLAAASLDDSVRVIAIGKAAAAMALGAHDVLGRRLERTLIVTKAGHLPADLPGSLRAVEIVIGGHPVPDSNSLAAGAAILRCVDTVPSGTQLLFLISGGASSLAEVLVPGATLDELARLNDWLLGSGWPIDRVNAVRSRLSQLKAGGLARYVGRRPARGLLISDVPGDDPAVIGSGMLASRSPTELPEGLPARWRQRLVELAPPPPESPPMIESSVVARAEDLRDAVVRAARDRGLRVEARPQRFEGAAIDVAARIVEWLRAADCDLVVAVGESTVTLPDTPGRGGRNQHLALAAACGLERGADALLLAAGSDGTDGPTEDAGAIVDSHTIERGRLAGLDPSPCLARAAAGEFLEASGDLLNCGPTGTNVGDVLIGMTSAGLARYAAQSEPQGNHLV